MQPSPEIQALLPEAVRLRRALHRIPELGFELFETQALVMETLGRCRPDRLETFARTGVRAVFHTHGAEETVAFRADMDALPNREETGLDFASRFDGRMHGCGHDGHTTVLLLLAQWIAAHRGELKVSVVLLFQPGEEGWAGARRMIDEGALEDPRPDRIYGLHLWPTVPKGKIGVRWGYQMAQTSDFECVVHGRSAHASTPQMGVDAIVVAAELITMLQSVITRDVDPHQDALLTLGKIRGGTAHNVIADEVRITGTLRTFSDELFRTLVDKVRALTQGLEIATGARFELNRKVYYPCVNNPRPLVERLYACLDSMDDAYLVEPVMAAEDFSEFQRELPGVFVFLGIAGGRGGAPLHSACFDFDEDVLLVGAELFRRIITR
jgi:amidohydrolase